VQYSPHWIIPKSLPTDLGLWDDACGVLPPRNAQIVRRSLEQMCAPAIVLFAGSCQLFHGSCQTVIYFTEGARSRGADHGGAIAGVPAR
jgi:hypothetical protein